MFKNALSAVRSAQGKIELAIVGLGATIMAYATAATDAESTAFADMATQLEDIISGPFGKAASIIAFLIGLVMMFTSGHKISALLVGLGIPAAIHWGPAIFEGLSGAGVLV